MTPEREQELAKQLGLDQPPPPRYEVPKPNAPVPATFRPKFYQAVMLVDQIETWAFERFIPSFIALDRNIDARIFSPELSFAFCIRTDVPPPVNEKIGRALHMVPQGHAEQMSAENFYRWLAVGFADTYRELGAKRAALPLVYRTEGRPKKFLRKAIIPHIGLIMKFDRTPKDGRKMEEMMADIGVIVPASMKGQIKEAHRFIPAADLPVKEVDDEDQGQDEDQDEN